jgi:hypothetical protein
MRGRKAEKEKGGTQGAAHLEGYWGGRDLQEGSRSPDNTTGGFIEVKKI